MHQNRRFVNGSVSILITGKERIKICELDLRQARRASQSIIAFMVKKSNEAWRKASRKDYLIPTDY